MAISNKKICILQSNYIPWKGYFDLIAAVDEFIIYDDMQYTRRDWRNRNKIKTPQGVQWLSVPIRSKGKFYDKIRHTKIDGSKWAIKHWRALASNYSRTPYFAEIAEWLEPLYVQNKYTYITELNSCLIKAICNYLNIETAIKYSWEYQLVGDKNKRLASLCLQADGNEYISGSAAKSYIDTSVFNANKIKLTWFDYEGYPHYEQPWGDFIDNVSILDLLFNCGKSSYKYMKYKPRII